jgi:hypothetical protein
MAETVLFTGNGINNISNGKSWENLLKVLYKDYYDPAVKFAEIKNKSFPMLYEQIVAHQLKQKKGEKIEGVIKKIIAEDVKSIRPNKVHQQIINGQWKNIITANYEFNLMKNSNTRLKNEGCIREQLYSVFRNFEEGGKRYWHLHGDAQNIHSINLGYEHYCGQLQRMREYVTGGYKSENKELTEMFKLPLLKRPYLNTDNNYSWLDFFFKDNTHIKIIGLKLDLEELDLWWLITHRAKIMYGAKKGLRVPVNNRIEYFIPREFTTAGRSGLTPDFKAKKDLMEKMDIEVRIIDIPHSEAFYLEALK